MSETSTLRDANQVTELLILPGGTILVHNLTPTLARSLSELDPEDEAMRRRANPETEEIVPKKPLALPPSL